MNGFSQLTSFVMSLGSSGIKIHPDGTVALKKRKNTPPVLFRLICFTMLLYLIEQAILFLDVTIPFPYFPLLLLEFFP